MGWHKYDEIFYLIKTFDPYEFAVRGVAVANNNFKYIKGYCKCGKYKIFGKYRKFK